MCCLTNNSKPICPIRKKQKVKRNDETNDGTYTNITLYIIICLVKLSYLFI